MKKQAVIDTLLSDIVLNKGTDGEIYATYEIDGHHETHNIKEMKCKAYFRDRCREIAQDDSFVFRMNDLQPEIDRVVLYDPPVEMNARLCQTREYVEIALADEDKNIIHISKDFFYVNNQLDTLFIEKPYMEALPLPEETDKSLEELLRPYINLAKDDFILFLCLLITMFFKNISHYCLIITAKLGCGKTTLANIIGELVDYAKGGVAVMPPKVDDLRVAMSSSYIVSLDNLTEKDIDGVSDLLCSAITGSVYRKRKLYSDLDEVNVPLKNIVILNGIDLQKLPHDLLSRSVLLNPQELTKDNRRSETEFWESFHKDKPKILYKIVETIRTVLSIRKDIEVLSNERMTDVYGYLIAAGVALGYEQSDIETLVYNNRQSINKLAYQEENGLASMISDFVKSLDGNSIVGSVSAIYKKICNNCNPEDYGVERFPQSASAFSRKLSEIQPELLKNGISMVKSTKKNFTQITLSNRTSKSKRIIHVKADKHLSSIIDREVTIVEPYHEEGSDDDEDNDNAYYMYDMYNWGINNIDEYIVDFSIIDRHHGEPIFDSDKYDELFVETSEE